MRGVKCTSICLALLCGLPGAGKTSLAGLLRSDGHLVAGNSHTGLHKEDEEVEAGAATVLHLCYDDVIPRQLELDGKASATASDASLDPDPSLSSVSPWKAHRREILHCVDWLLGRMKTEDGSDVATILEKSRTCAERLELSEIAAKVWRTMLTLFQSQLRDGAIRKQEPASTLSLGERNSLSTSPVVLIVDDNMYYRSMRYEYYQLARKHNTGICLLYVHCSAEVAVARNSCRSNAIPAETVLKMAKRLEEPDGQLAPWEQHSFRMEADKMDMPDTRSDVWKLIFEALLNPVAALEEDNNEEKEASRAECAASTIHQADRSLRRCVAAAMAEAKGTEGGLPLTKAGLRALASDLNATRQDILQGMREGRILPPPLVATQINGSVGARACSEFDSFVQDLFQKERTGS